MHILIVANNLLPGGAERVIVQLLSEWVEKNIECSLIVINKTKHYYTLPEAVHFYEFDTFSKKRVINKLKKYKEVRKIVKKISPDIVLSMPEEIGIYTIGALLGTKTPIVVSERNNPRVMPYKKVTRALRRILYPFADGLIFQTTEAASFFSEKNQKKGIVLPNPLDLSRIPSVYEGEREKVVIGAGRLEAQKNFKLLIEAFSDFYKSHEDYKLVIYGEGSKRGDLEEYAKAKLPEGAYSLPGAVTDLPARMNKASMFVLSSDFEGMPNVLIEAMASGVPSISTDCPAGGAGELMVNGENGFLIPVGDKGKMVESMHKLADTNIGKTFSKESVKIKDKLDSRAVSMRWLEYLETVISRSKKS